MTHEIARRWTWPWMKRWLTSAATEHLAYKFSALFFALVLWLIVSGERLTEESVRVDFIPVVDSSLAIVAPIPAVTVTVLGRAREILKLYQAPPVLRPAFDATTPGIVTLPLTVNDIRMPNGVDALVREVQPTRVTLHFAPVPNRAASSAP